MIARLIAVTLLVLACATVAVRAGDLDHGTNLRVAVLDPCWKDLNYEPLDWPFRWRSETALMGRCMTAPMHLETPAIPRAFVYLTEGAEHVDSPTWGRALRMIAVALGLLAAAAVAAVRRRRRWVNGLLLGSVVACIASLIVVDAGKVLAGEAPGTLQVGSVAALR